MTNIVVVGSINMDLVALTPRFPAAGETLIGQDMLRLAGGKGANQAVAASRLGAQVTMVGAVGDDNFGNELLANLARENVLTHHVRAIEGVSTGVAAITAAGGENTIIVIPGANFELRVSDVYAAEEAIAAADVLLAQLEVPMPVVETAAILAQKHNIPFILNPAPAQHLSETLLDKISLLTPNQHELALILNTEHADFTHLLKKLPGKVVMTHGAQGAYHCSDQGDIYHQPGFEVDVIDTTGAGDTFNAALAVHWHQGIKQAIHTAAAAAALSVTRLGAQSGMPVADELAIFLQEKA